MDKPQNPGELAVAIASQVDGVEAPQVEAMFAVWQAVQEGDPVGTVRRNPQDGLVYVRVNCDGIPKWRVVNPEDGCANTFDMTGAIVWPILYRDENQVQQETDLVRAVNAAIDH